MTQRFSICTTPLYRLIFISTLAALSAFSATAAAPALNSSDVGAVAAAGSTSVANDVFTIRGSGADIWGAADEFRFAYASLNGDGEISVRIDSLSATDPWTKAGVMIRESLQPGARYAFSLVTSAYGADFQYRQSTNGAAGPSSTNDGVTRAPYWLRVRRAGNVFTSFVSADGATWNQRGSVTIAMSASTFIGIALTSHLDGTLATAVVSNVTIGGTSANPPPAPPPPSPPPPSGTVPALTSADVGAVSAPGSTSTANGVLTLRASGDDVWGAQDEFRFAYRSLTADGEIVARIDSVSATDPWTKVGLMFRESLSPGSRYAMVMLTPGHGSDFQYRVSTSGAAGPGGTADHSRYAPYWLRLRRSGNLFTADVSTDGAAWTQRGSVTIAMSSGAYVGLALTSHLDGTLATANFSNIVVQNVSAPPPQGSPPQISGTPQTKVSAGQSYSFTPTASDPDGDALFFDIANRPGWLAFSATTGALNGTPASADAGMYSGVTIQVSAGGQQATLAPFAIEVMQGASGNVAVHWTPPTQNQDGTAITDLGGFRIRYGTDPGSYANVITIANPGITSHVIQNLAPDQYYFVFTAYNANGVESAYSQEISVVL